VSAGVAAVRCATTRTSAGFDIRPARGPARFHLLVPGPADPDWRPRHGERHSTAGDEVLALGLPLVEKAAGRTVEGSVPIRHDPMDAIEETLLDGELDEIIHSTFPRSVSRWLHIDLPRRVAHLGLPLTTVIAKEHAGASVI
jgi:hypothetical protein